MDLSIKVKLIVNLRISKCQIAIDIAATIKNISFQA